MKNVMINAYQVGLLYKHGTYQRMLKEGDYWIRPSSKLDIYDLTKPFAPATELNILLKDHELAEALHIVEVKDNELVLRYENGLLKEVLTPGRYAYWKGIIVYGFFRLDISGIGIPEYIDRPTLTHRLLAPYVRMYTVENYEKALLLVDGKYIRMLESGVYFWWKNSIAISVSKIDTRQLQLDINGQEILTRDKATLRINACAQYRIVNIEKALLENKECERQLYIAFQLGLREYIGSLTFDELLDKKDAALPFVVEKVQDTAATLGVEVAGFGIRDISERSEANERGGACRSSSNEVLCPVM